VVSAGLSGPLLAGALGIGGVVIGAALTHLSSFLQHRRQKADERRDAHERESAVFHGAFALANFIAGKLNDWDETRDVYSLARLTVAQPYLAKLIDRSPPASERLMVSLVDLGLRLEALMFSCGFVVGVNPEPFDNLLEIEKGVNELAAAVEMVQIILTGELPLLDAEDMAKLGFDEKVEPAESAD